MSNKTSIVFVHGIWADGSSFSKLIPTLQGEGHEVIAAQYGLDTLAGDVAAVKSALGRVTSPAILVGHSSPRGWARLHRRTRAGRQRNVTESAEPVSHHRCLFAHRNCRRTHLAETGRRRVLRGRLARAGAEDRVGDPRCTGGGPVQPEGRGHRLEVEAELVRPGHQGPDCPSPAATLRGESYGRYDPRGRQQPRPHALLPRPRTRCHPQRRKRPSVKADFVAPIRFNKHGHKLNVSTL
jgi:hypothetical protein